MTKALVIDDDDIARELLASILKDGGYETFDLPSPIGATQIIFREQIEVVVVDLMMPALSGDKFVRMLRSNPRLKGLIIVLVSSFNVDQVNELAASARPNAVVSKADLRKDLLAIVNAARASQVAEAKRGIA
jgi:CheY-like chemotaxis protein